MTFQLTNNEWLNRVDTELSVDQEHFLGVYSSPFVVVLIKPRTKETGWTQGGYLAQKIPFNDTIAYADPKSIKLDFLTLLEFSLLPGKDYELYYFPLPRLDSAIIRVWEYQGEINNTSTDELVTVLSQPNILNFDGSMLEKIEKTLAKQQLQSKDCDKDLKEYNKIPIVLL